MKTLYTIGHSTKTIQTFINKLVEHRIEVLIDVRSIPYSKWNPQFNRENLSSDLAKEGIKYVFRGKNLGGKLGNENWDEAIDEICEKCENRKIAVMCSEGDPDSCHRKSTIQPAVEKRGVMIEHILWENTKKKVKVDVVEIPTLF